MRRYLPLLIFVLSFCFAANAQARKLALLVGVDDYANVPSLKCCVNDMKTLKAALIKIGFDNDDIQMLVTGSNSVRELPTKKKIEQSISDILSQAQSSDMVFFAFSGHGAQERGNVYFCPPFADPEDLDKTCVSITKVMDDLAKSRAKFKWMVVDACRNDPAQGAKGIGGKGLQVVPAPPAGIALFQSCAEGEESWEDRASGNGYFTKNLAAALSGSADADRDGQLTLLEVCKWTTSQTKAEVEKAERKTQRPYFSGTVHDFTLSEDLNVPKAKKAAVAAQKAMDEENYELAIKKYDEAIALCPRFDSWKRERRNAQKLLDSENRERREDQKRKEAEKNDLSIPGKMEGERKTVTVNGVEFAFRWCPPGTFTMGSPTSEEGRYDNEISHRVTLTKGFWMMETEVTVGMFKAFVSDTGYESKGNTPYGVDDNKWEQDSKYSWRNPGFSQDDNHPVTNVSWNDAVEFCKWLSRKTGQNITLPTEAQWEYACRAGSTTALPNGPIVIKGLFNAPALDTIAWYGGNSSQGFVGHSGADSSKWSETQYPGGPCGTHPVGKKNPNNWGLYDMIGNVLEWCADWYGDYPSGSVTDPTGPSNGSPRVGRGGGWGRVAITLKASAASVMLAAWSTSAS